MSNLTNKETGFEIATVPEKLPPLREGYIRLVHQTHFEHADSLVENGLIYNGEFAHKEPFPHYTDITSMAVAYDEDGFWQRLTKEEIRHKGADAIAIFDMPMEECGAHQKEPLTPMLNGTISRGYMVGIIPNYGTKDGITSEKLSVSEMEEKKAMSKSNPLPPYYETPNWRENVEKAWNAFLGQGNDREDKANSESWFDVGNETTSTVKPEFVFNEKTGDFNYANPEFQQKADARHQNKLENQDYLEYKLDRIRKKLSYEGLDEDMGKTGDSRTGGVSEKHKRVADIQKETAKTSPLRFAQIAKSR